MITGFVHQVQLAVLIKAVGMGYFLGIIFSVFMFLNVLFGKSTAAVFIRDILFFIIAAFCSFLFSLKYCSGMIRFYVLAGELMGFLIFFIFPGKQLSCLWRKTAEYLFNKTDRIRKKVKESISHNITKVKVKLFSKNKKQQKNTDKNPQKKYIGVMTKKLLKYTKKTQKI